MMCKFFILSTIGITLMTWSLDWQSDLCKGGYIAVVIIVHAFSTLNEIRM